MAAFFVSASPAPSVDPNDKWKSFVVITVFRNKKIKSLPGVFPT
jgi:hypothetical protein